MMVVVAGATGFVGRKLVEALSKRGDAVVVLTRSPQGASARQLATLPGVRAVAWGSDPGGAWESMVEQADAVVNLAGEPVVGRRWSAGQKARIRDSRVQSTQALVQAMQAAARKPSVFVNASAIGWYGDRGDETLDESAPPGADFLAQVCIDWEAAAKKAPAAVRTVLLRIGIVLGEEGGSLAEMVRPFRLGVGGPLGTGRQWISWIHRDDLVSMLLFALDGTIEGAVNGTAPRPVQQADLAKAIGRTLHRPSWLPVPHFALKLALGEVADMLMGGQRVLPKRAQEAGFVFRHVDLDAALRDILK